MSDTSHNELELLRDCIDAKPGAWDVFVKQFSKLIYYSINKTLKVYSGKVQPEDVEDLYSGTFLLFLRDDYKKLRQFRGGCSLSSWVRLVTVRHTIDFLRSQKHHVSIDSADDDTLPLSETIRDNSRPVDDRLEDAETGRMFSEAVASLNASDQLFMKCYFEKELPVEEIAVIMDVSINTIYSRKKRVREKIEKVLMERGIIERNP